MIHKYITDIETKTINEEERSFVAWASKGTMDRDDDVIEPNGWDLANFKKNPIIPLFHDYSEFPVAKALWIKKEPKDNPIGLLFKPQFAETKLGEEAFYLYKNGYMNAFSVGFDPQEWESDGNHFSKDKDGSFDIWQKDFIQQKKRKPRCKFNSQDLLEISGVIVPAHPDAIVEARSFAKSPELTKYFDMMLQKQAEPSIDDMKERIAKLETQIQSIKHENIDDDVDFIDDDIELDFIEDDQEEVLEFIEAE